MRFLAIDTSLQATSAAIMEIGATSTKMLLAEQYLNVDLTHSETTQCLVESCIKNAHLQLSDIDYFVAVTGPGSFTGLRIGVTLTKTLAATQKKPCIAVNSLSVLAYKLRKIYRSDPRTMIIPLIDARNERVFAQVIAQNKLLYETQGIAFADLLDSLLRKFRGECQLIFVSTGDLPFFAKYANSLANFRSFYLIKHELTAAKALDLVAEDYIKHTCQFLPYNDLQPNYYALSQAERSRQLAR